MLMKYIANEPRRVVLTSRERRTAKCHWNYRQRQRRAAGAGRAAAWRSASGQTPIRQQSVRIHRSLFVRWHQLTRIPAFCTAHRRWRFT